MTGSARNRLRYLLGSAFDIATRHTALIRVLRVIGYQLKLDEAVEELLRLLSAT